MTDFQKLQSAWEEIGALKNKNAKLIEALEKIVEFGGMVMPKEIAVDALKGVKGDETCRASARGRLSCCQR
jgi:hypothetical protein